MELEIKGARELIKLGDGEVMEILQLDYPIIFSQQMKLIRLLREEWRHTDVEWLDSMSGCHADTLQTCTEKAWILPFTGRIFPKHPRNLKLFG